MADRFLVTLDDARFDRKPHGVEIAAITRRLQMSGPCEVTPEQFAQAIADGRTWCGGCYKPSTSGWGEFVGQRLFAIDVDNDTEVLGENGRPKKDASGHKIKRPLMPDESGYLDPWQCVGRWNKVFHADPLIIYPSMRFSFTGRWLDRWSKDTRLKFRCVLDAGEFVTDEQRAHDILEKLLALFPEADTGCSNVNRLFFGSCGWAILCAEGETYVKRS